MVFLAQLVAVLLWFGALHLAYKASEGRSIYFRRTVVELTELSVVLLLLGLVYIITR